MTAAMCRLQSAVTLCRAKSSHDHSVGSFCNLGPHRAQLCREASIPPAKVFVAIPPRQGSTNSPPDADEDDSRASQKFAAAICEAYEHALASFQLKNAA